MTPDVETRGESARLGPAAEGLCLVTGASGFIGSHVAARLRQGGWPVRCLVRRSSQTALLEELEVELAYGDLTNAESLTRAVSGCRYVLHCAALVSDWATVSEIRRINVEGTRHLVDAAVSASVQRLVHLSSTDVYGYPGGQDIDETHVSTQFRNWYAQTKLEAEREVRRFAEPGALETVILRPATVYGPRSGEVVGEMAKALRAGHMLLVDQGRAVAGLTYVENVADAAVLALVHEAAPGQAFNVTDGLGITWRQFLDDLAAGLGAARARWSLPYPLAWGVAASLELGYRMLRRSTGLTTPPLLSRQAVHVLGRPQAFSNRKARTRLGWEPRVDYAGGLDATLSWLRDEYLRPG